MWTQKWHVPQKYPIKIKIVIFTQISRHLVIMINSCVGHFDFWPNVMIIGVLKKAFFSSIFWATCRIILYFSGISLEKLKASIFICSCNLFSLVTNLNQLFSCNWTFYNIPFVWKLRVMHCNSKTNKCIIFRTKFSI